MTSANELLHIFNLDLKQQKCVRSSSIHPGKVGITAKQNEISKLNYSKVIASFAKVVSEKFGHMTTIQCNASVCVE